VNKTIFQLILAIFLPFVLISFLFYHSKKTKANGGFYRYFIPHPLSKKAYADLTFNSFYFAGSNEDLLYLGNRTSHRYVLTVSSDLKTLDSLKLIIPSTVNTSSTEIHLYSRSIFLSDGNRPFLFYTALPELKMNTITLPGIGTFTGVLAINGQSLILRTYSNILRKSTLTKISCNHGFKETTNLLERSIDGYYSCDGTMCFDEDSHEFVYVYRYTNQFIKADTNLNLVYRSRTIDTIRFPQIKIGSYQTAMGTSTTFAAPPLAVNNFASASKGLLYIQSLLRSNSEDEKIFNLYFVIDVYSLSDGHYKFSFYLPREKRHILKDLIVVNRTLFILYDHFIQSFKLTFEANPG
jgi:hypothetical protein